MKLCPKCHSENAITDSFCIVCKSPLLKTPEKVADTAAEKAAKDRTDRIAAEKAAKDRADRVAAEKAAKDRADKIAAEKAAKDRAERIRIEEQKEKRKKIIIGLAISVTVIVLIIWGYNSYLNNATVRFNRGENYRRNNDYDRAITEYTEAIRINPEYAIAYARRGFVFHEKSDYDSAIADYSAAIRIEPTAIVYHNRAVAYYNKRDYAYAIVDYTEAIRLEPTANRYNQRGNAYRQRNEYDQAISDYEAALRLDPNHANAKEGLNNARQQQQQNTSFERARTITLGSATNATLQTNISQYYSITVGAGTLVAHTTGNIDTVMWLYGSNRNQLAYDDDSGMNRNARISRAVSAGTYFIRVGGHGSTSGAYTLHVSLQPTTYTITYNMNGGTGTAPAAQTANAGSSVTLRSGSGLTRSGYTFAGWNTNASGTGTTYNASSSFRPTSNITLYARWNTVASTYTLTYNLNGGTGTAPASQTVNIGDWLTLHSGGGITRSGYTFSGWNANTSGTGSNYNAGSSVRLNGNTTLHACWLVTTWNRSDNDGRRYTMSFPRSGVVSISIRNRDGSIERDEGSYTLNGGVLTLNFEGFTETYTYSPQRIANSSNQNVIYTP